MDRDSFTSAHRRARQNSRCGVFIKHAPVRVLRTHATGALPTLVLVLILLTIDLLIAFVVFRVLPSVPVAASPTAIERGRMVYISEGCIHCHSQHIRLSSADVLMSKPIENPGEFHQGRPALAGNRGQGPDLSQVGARRSPLWLKMHLYDPREVSGASTMPTYTFLFLDQRGNDLVAYLASLGGEETENHALREQRWHLPAQAIAAASPAGGQRLYDQYCATCHNADGRTRLKWQSEFTESPPILTRGAMAGSSSRSARCARIDHLAQIIKFGIPESDMPGHEHLSEKDIASLSTWLLQRAAQPVRRP